MTKENWFCSLSTEDKAKVIFDLLDKGLCSICNAKSDCRTQCIVQTKDDEIEIISHWLRSNAIRSMP